MSTTESNGVYPASCDPFRRRAPLRTTPAARDPKTRNRKAHSRADEEPIWPAKHDDDSNRRPAVRSGADYARRPVEWLWHKRIPIGKVTLLCGDPGLGKSLVALDIAARVTTGAPFPATPCCNGSQPPRGTRLPGRPGVLGEPENNPSAINLDLPHSANVDCPNTTTDPRQSRGLPGENAPGSVLVLTNEDDIADTVRPRFEALGGDLHRIFFDESIANLRDDFARLVETLDSIPDCRLIIVDPVNAFVGPSDSHFHTVVRRVLKPLANLAKERGIAILAVTHLRKNNGTTIQRAAGTMGFVGFARSVWTISQDSRDTKRRVVVPAKNNLGPTDEALAYSIAVHEELDVPMVAWESKPLEAKDIEEATTPIKKSRGPDPEERNAAAEWLTTALRQEPRIAGGLIKEGKELGFSPRTLRRGLKAIGGTTRHLGEFFGWQWSLPKAEAAPSDSPSDASPNDAATSVPPDASASTPPSESDHTITADPQPSSAPDSSPEDTHAKPGPLETTWPLAENKHVPASGTRHSKAAAPPPDPSAEIDDDLLDASMQFLDACRERRRKAEPIPPPEAKTRTPDEPHPLNGHPLIAQIAALAQRDQAQPTDCALGATGSASACGGLPATGLPGGERIADQSHQKSGDNRTRPGPACA